LSGFLKRPKRAGTTKDKSTKQERRLAKETGGITTPGSGALWMKGDVQTRGSTDPFADLPTGEVIEAKTTKHKQISLKLDWLTKVGREAAAVGKRPVLIIEFDNESLRPTDSREYVVIPKGDYDVLRSYADND